MRSWMKKKSLLFSCIGILLGETNRTRRRKHRHSIADASQSCSGTLASIGDGSPKPSTTLSHRIHIADVYTSMLGASPMCRWCICDIFNLRVPQRIFADYCALIGAPLRYISDGSWRQNMDFSMSWCLSKAWRLLSHVADDLPSYWRMVALPKFVHHENIRRLKNPVGP